MRIFFSVIALKRVLSAGGGQLIKGRRGTETRAVGGVGRLNLSAWRIGGLNCFTWLVSAHMHTASTIPRFTWTFRSGLRLTRNSAATSTSPIGTWHCRGWCSRWAVSLTLHQCGISNDSSSFTITSLWHCRCQHACLWLDYFGRSTSTTESWYFQGHSLSTTHGGSTSCRIPLSHFLRFSKPSLSTMPHLPGEMDFAPFSCSSVPTLDGLCTSEQCTTCGCILSSSSCHQPCCQSSLAVAQQPYLACTLLERKSTTGSGPLHLRQARHHAYQRLNTKTDAIMQPKEILSSLVDLLKNCNFYLAVVALWLVSEPVLVTLWYCIKLNIYLQEACGRLNRNWQIEIYAANEMHC